MNPEDSAVQVNPEPSIIFSAVCFGDHWKPIIYCICPWEILKISKEFVSFLQS